MLLTNSINSRCFVFPQMKPEKNENNNRIRSCGVDYKSEVVEFLEKEKHEVLDVGTFSQKV